MDALERLEREADRALWLADPELAAEFGVTELPPPPRPPDSDDTFPKPEAGGFRCLLRWLRAAVTGVLDDPPPGVRHGHIPFEAPPGTRHGYSVRAWQAQRQGVRPRQPTTRPGGPPPQPPPGPARQVRG